MTLHGWKFNIVENKPLDFSHQCGSSTWYGWSSNNLVGHVSAIFSGKGQGILKFGNCGMEGRVLAILDGIKLGYARRNESITTSFEYKPRSILVIMEFGGAIIKLHEMKLICNK